MKLLTATSRTQGQRASDFAWCVEGELVTNATVICDRDRAEGPDSGCGCGRSFTGLNSHKGTTAAIVRDIEGFTLDDLTEAVLGYRGHAGWSGPGEDQGETLARARAAAGSLAELASSYPAGTVLERRLDVVRPREAEAGGGA